MNNQEIQDTLDRFWRAKMAGDKQAVQQFLAPDATLELVGASAFADQATMGPTSAVAAAERLIDDFQFHSLDQLILIAEGDDQPPERLLPRRTAGNHPGLRRVGVRRFGQGEVAPSVRRYRPDAPDDRRTTLSRGVPALQALIVAPVRARVHNVRVGAGAFGETRLPFRPAPRVGGK